MDTDRFDKLEAKVDALHGKLDRYHEQTVRNTSDVAWLKKTVVGTFTMLVVGAIGAVQKFISGAP